MAYMMDKDNIIISNLPILVISKKVLYKDRE